MPITLVTADDQQMLLTLYGFLADELGMTVLESCKSPQAVIEAYSKHLPNVLLLDIRFKDNQSGFDVARTILENHSDANIVFISQYDQASYVGEAYQIGAKAFLTKNCDSNTFRAAIQAASEGRKMLIPELKEKAEEVLLNADRSPRNLLHEKQLKVFKLLAKGATNEEIAEELKITTRTVSAYRKEIQDILHISRPQQLTIMAMKNELI